MTQRSQNLKDTSKKEDEAQKEKRKIPRILVGYEQFRIKPDGKVFSLGDLSHKGMSLRILDPNDSFSFSLGSEIEGTMNLMGKKFPIKANVRHVSKYYVGCEFLSELEPETQKALRQFLDPDFLGKTLKPMPYHDQSVIWYHGPTGVDVLLWRELDGSFNRFSLFLFSQYVQWNEKEGVSTGQTFLSDDQVEISGIVRFETTVLNKDKKVDPGKLEIAKRLVLSSIFPEDLKHWCCRRLGEKNGS